VAEVRLARDLELLALVFGHESHRGADRVVGGQGGEGRRAQLAVHANERHVAGLEVQVARPDLDRVAKQFVDVQVSVSPIVLVLDRELVARPIELLPYSSAREDEL
jgi:hypothetical protein